MQRVRNYTTNQLLKRVEQLPSFRGFPENYWLIGIRSQEDEFNLFDDKAYLFKGREFIEVYQITTNAGNDILHPTNPRGEAVLKSDEIYYDSWIRGTHRQKVEAYVQSKPLPIYRDLNRNSKIEEYGVPREELVGINIHPATYIKSSKEVKIAINGWSLGCQVFAKRDGLNSYNSFMKLTKGQNKLTYCLLKEFDPRKVNEEKKIVTKLTSPLSILSTEETITSLPIVNEIPQFNVNNQTSQFTKKITGGAMLTWITSTIANVYDYVLSRDLTSFIIIFAILSLIPIIFLINYRISSKQGFNLNKKV